jgi:hypothetical protein
MNTRLAAALVLLPFTALGQSGVSPNNPGAVGIAKPNVPSPTPTRATGAAAFSAAAGQVKPPAPALLHLDAQVRHLACGTPLEFEIVVSNRGTGPFSGGADLHVSGPPLNQAPIGGFIRISVQALAPGASQTFHLKAPPPVKVDCVAPQKFLATLTPGANLIQPHPQWDRDAVEVTTTPPTNCSATSGFRHVRGWDPRT